MNNIPNNNNWYALFQGDLFEKFEDIEDQNVWLTAGSESPVLQKKNRSIVADLADWVIPGHGPKFKITEEIRETLRRQKNGNCQTNKTC